MARSKFSYFELCLKAYLRENFPDKEKDTDLISSRAVLASEAYSQAILDGYTHQGAAEKAQAVLFEGLHFSPYNTIREVLEREFSDSVPETMQAAFALLVLVMSRQLFAKYAPKDDFAYTGEYEQLYTELTGFIVLILEKNGLQ